MLRLTLLTSAVASATFVATLAYAPAIISAGERLAFGQEEIEGKTAPAIAAEEDNDCRSIFGRIVAGLRSDPCLRSASNQ